MGDPGASVPGEDVISSCTRELYVLKSGIDCIGCVGVPVYFVFREA